MKYPQSQFDKLVKALPVVINTIFKPGQDFTYEMLINTLHPNDLHFRVFVQLTYEDINPNVFNKTKGRLCNSGGERLLNRDEDFKLYPDGCNDTHVFTAMKAALKEIIQSGALTPVSVGQAKETFSMSDVDAIMNSTSQYPIQEVIEYADRCGLDYAYCPVCTEQTPTITGKCVLCGSTNQ